MNKYLSEVLVLLSIPVAGLCVYLISILMAPLLILCIGPLVSVVLMLSKTTHRR